MPDRHRPDKAKLYVSWDAENPILHVSVDASFPMAWREGLGKEIVDKLHKDGNHLLIMSGDRRFFIQGKNQPLPEHIKAAMEKHGDQMVINTIEMKE